MEVDQAVVGLIVVSMAILLVKLFMQNIGRIERRFRMGKKEKQLDELEGPLIPEICEDETLAKISTLLPRGTLNTLYMLRSSWRQATQDRLIYDTRVLAQSREMLSSMIVSMQRP
jgi:hypothetical protein